MSESGSRLTTLRLVALALAGVVILRTMAGPSEAWFLSSAKEISGRAIVIDGDTIEVDGRRIRLEGIDAPEMAQNCRRAQGASWGCGLEAAEVLSKLTGSRRVTCRSAGHDKYDRMLGQCSVDSLDLNAEMVRTGYAWAFVKYSTSYVAEEKAARAAMAGIWQGESEPAWIFREKRWQVAETKAPEGCAIKGNITENGHIYHMPWSPWYGRVKVDPALGERWFCSEAEARRAGWRSAGLR